MDYTKRKLKKGSIRIIAKGKEREGSRIEEPREGKKEKGKNKAIDSRYKGIRGGRGSN